MGLHVMAACGAGRVCSPSGRTYAPCGSGGTRAGPQLPLKPLYPAVDLRRRREQADLGRGVVMKGTVEKGEGTAKPQDGDLVRAALGRGGAALSCRVCDGQQLPAA